MKNRLKQGTCSASDTLNYTVPSATTISSGDIIESGSFAGIALTGGTADDVISVELTGVFTLVSASGSTAVTQGAEVYRDAATQEVTDDSDGGANTLLGLAYADSAMNGADVQVRLKG